MRAKRDVKDTTDIEKTGAADAEEQAQEQES